MSAENQTPLLPCPICHGPADTDGITAWCVDGAKLVCPFRSMMPVGSWNRRAPLPPTTSPAHHSSKCHCERCLFSGVEEAGAAPRPFLSIAEECLAFNPDKTFNADVSMTLIEKALEALAAEKDGMIEELLDILDEVTDEELRKQIAKARADYKRTGGIPVE